MAKICSECGKPVQPDWELCPYYGTRLAETLSSDSIKSSKGPNKDLTMNL